MADDDDTLFQQHWARERSVFLRAIANLEWKLAYSEQDISRLEEANTDCQSQIEALRQRNDESVAIIDNLTKLLENALINGQTSPTDRISRYRDTVVKDDAASTKGLNDEVNGRKNYSAGLALINAAKSANSVKSSGTTHNDGNNARDSTHSPVKSIGTHASSMDVNSKGAREAKFAMETKIYTALSHQKRRKVRKKPKKTVSPRSNNAFILPDDNVHDQYTIVVQDQSPETCDNHSVNSGLSTTSKGLPWERSNNGRPSVDYYLNMQTSKILHPTVDSPCNNQDIDPIVIPENYPDDLRIRELLSDINSNDYKNLTIHVPHRPSTTASSVSRMKKVQVPLGNIGSYGWGRPTSAYNYSKYENNQYNYYQVHSVNKHRSYQERPATTSDPQPSSSDSHNFYFTSNKA